MPGFVVRHVPAILFCVWESKKINMAANKKFTAIVLFAYFYLNQARANIKICAVITRRNIVNGYTVE